ncbi:hypothetical protein [Methylotenera sp.]|nr:hypothetical protein [Methylotenera sp.]MDI1297840.1 hypothetical protein [Methylotenera sp.]
MRKTPAIAEKDFWVVWVLNRVFANAELARILKFKGGLANLAVIKCELWK